jgi:hypothetical protein
MNKILLRLEKRPFLTSLLSGVGSTLIYNLLSALFQNRGFLTSIKEFWTLKVELWVYVGVIIVGFGLYKLIGQKRVLSYDSETLQLDKELFSRIRNEFLRSDLIHWVRNHDFGIAFDPELVIELSKIEDENQKPEFEFIHPRLEKHKTRLVNEINLFDDNIKSYCFGNREHFISIPPEWEYKQPERFKRAFDELNRSRKRLCDSYDLFIKMVRRMIKV